MSEEPSLVGELLDEKYQIEKLLGQGGMGAVYRATHLGTKRIVAIKVIHPQFSNDEEFVQRFRREAEATGRLRHPNVVDVTDFGFAKTNLGRVAYLVMEYLDGCTLEEILAEEKSLRLAWVVDILDQVCSAVDAAHRLGIVHRDLKPDNIWLEPNRRGGYTVKVLDFGLVKLGGSAGPPAIGVPKSVVSLTASVSGTDSEAVTLLQPSAVSNSSADDVETLIQKPSGASESRSTDPNADASEIETAVNLQSAGATGGAYKIKTQDMGSLTQVGSVMGTPLYMSPEQCRGDAVDSRSDIYSLGVIAYRMLAGETPFTGKVIDLIKAHSSLVPVSVKQKNRKVPKKMAQVIMAALEKDPIKRPQTASGFASALRTGAQGVGALLRQSISLYSERFPIFLKVSLIAYTPFIVLVLLNHFSDKVIPWERMAEKNVPVMLVAALLILATFLSQMGAHSVVRAVTIPIVLQSIIAPLRPVQIRTAFAALKRRWVVFAITTVIVLFSTIFGMILLVIPGITIATIFALYSPVVIMEDLGVRATLKRAYRLMKRSKFAALVITVLQFTLPSLIYRSTTSFNYKVNSSEVSFNLGSSGSYTQLLIVLITPFAAIMTSLLYLKAREAGGEGVAETIEHLTAHEMPTSKWEKKMTTGTKL